MGRGGRQWLGSPGSTIQLPGIDAEQQQKGVAQTGQTQAVKSPCPGQFVHTVQERLICGQRCVSVCVSVSVGYCGGAWLTVSACIQGRRPGLGGPREQPSPPPGPLLGQGPYSFYRQVDIWIEPHRQIITIIISSAAHRFYGSVIFSFKFVFCLLSFITVDVIIRNTFFSTRLQ